MVKCLIDRQEIEPPCEAGCIHHKKCPAHWSNFEKKEGQQTLFNYGDK